MRQTESLDVRVGDVDLHQSAARFSFSLDRGDQSVRAGRHVRNIKCAVLIDFTGNYDSLRILRTQHYEDLHARIKSDNRTAEMRGMSTDEREADRSFVSRMQVESCGLCALHRAGIVSGNVGGVRELGSRFVEGVLRWHDALEIYRRTRRQVILPGQQTSNTVFTQVIGLGTSRRFEFSSSIRECSPPYNDFSPRDGVAILVQDTAGNDGCSEHVQDLILEFFSRL